MSAPTLTRVPDNAVPAAPEQATTPKGGGKKKKLLIGVVALAVAGGAGWYFLAPGGDEGEAEPVPAGVVRMDPISINLADGHYLKLGLALQLAETEGGGHGELDGAHALDLAIDTYSGRSVAELSTAEGRHALKDELLEHLEEAYHGEVMDVYLTDFVTQ